jgi:hypothetical protein
MVGFTLALQQTPLAVIVLPPVELMFPPEYAVPKPIDVTDEVVSVASTPTELVVNVWSVPYIVPPQLNAFTL